MRNFFPRAATGVIATAVLFVSATFCFGQDAGDEDAFQKDKIVKALAGSSEVFRLRTVEELQNRFAHDPRTGEVIAEALLTRKTLVPTDSFLLMIQMLENFDTPQVVDTLLKLLESSRYEIVMVAVDSLGGLRAQEAVQPIIELAKMKEFDAVYGFRKCLLYAVIEIGTIESIDFAIEHLPKLDGQLEFDMVHFLSHASLQRFGRNTEAWATWWKDNREDFVFDQPADAFAFADTPSSDFVWDDDVPEFYGIKIYAKRPVFIIDRSSSMKGAKLARAKQELLAAVMGLPEDTHFNIVIFDAKTGTWKPRGLFAATDANKAVAAKFVEYITAGKGTASYDALIRGFGVDGNTEAIFFMSDGNPTKGQITDKAEIVKDITRRNFFRRMVIYSVGVGVGGEDEVFMRALATQNGGVYQAVN